MLPRSRTVERSRNAGDEDSLAVDRRRSKVVSEELPVTTSLHVVPAQTGLLSGEHRALT